MFKGDLKPEFVVELDDEGSPIPADQAGEVRVLGRVNNALAVDRSSLDGHVRVAGNEVTLLWQPGDTDVVGDMYLEVVLLWPDGPQSIEVEDVVTFREGPETTIVTLRELRDHMSDVDFTAAQEADAYRVLRSLQRSVERPMARRFVSAQQTDRTFTDESGYAPLDRSPVTQILSVNGVGVDPYSWSGGPVAMRGGVTGLTPLTWYDVTYVGGGRMTADDLEDVRMLILEKAAGIMRNRHDDAVTTQDLDVRGTTPPAPETYGFSRAELEPLDRLRRRVVH